MQFKKWLWLESNEPVVLYHGTLLKFLPQIQSKGLTTSEGWGGHGMEGVFLSSTPKGAEYWAKLAHQREIGGRLESDRFDREFGSQQGDLLVLLKVTIPSNETQWLRADMEQAEDYGFEGKEEDWHNSIEQIGDVTYIKPIPPNWIQQLP